MMDADEKEIFRYLKSQQGVFVTMNVISRHAAGKNRFNESSDWARAVLMRMAERNILQKDATGAVVFGTWDEEKWSALVPRLTQFCHRIVTGPGSRVVVCSLRGHYH